MLSTLRQWFTPPKWEQPHRRYDELDIFTYNGSTYPLQGQTTWGQDKADPIAHEYLAFINGGLKANGIVWALALKRFTVFSEARFQFKSLVDGKLFGKGGLSVLERPFPGGTTGDLLTRMLLEADFAGNAYRIRYGDEIVALRPDWVEIILGERMYEGGTLGFTKLGYQYYHGGKHSGVEPIFLTAEQVAHFAPYPDPAASYRGMSWLTPVIREIQTDKLMVEHKSKFLENAATPNLHVKWPERMKEEHFRKAIELLDERHAGASNAYKTLYTDGGADVTVLGKDFQQMDFKAVQGAGETRLAAAAGVPAVIAGFSEGMQGSSLNAGNYQSAKRNFADTTMANLWRNVAGSLETIVPPPAGAELWYDTKDIAFLRDDANDRAQIQQTNSISIRNYTDAGFTPESAVAAVLAEDESLLQHSGLFSVQLQAAGVEPVVEPDDARSQPLIADGAIRVEVHPPSVDVDARTMPGAVNASSSNNPVEAIERTAEQMAMALDTVLERRAEMDARRDEERAAAEETRAAHWFDMSARVVESIDAMRAEAARPRRKRVETDEIGRITAVVEEQI